MHEIKSRFRGKFEVGWRKVVGDWNITGLLDVISTFIGNNGSVRLE